MSLSAGTFSQTAGESRLYTFDFTRLLGSSETVSSATATVSPSGPTIGDPAVNGGSVSVDGVTIAASKAVQVRVSGLSAGTDYTVTVRASTSANNTLDGWCTITGVSP